MRNKRQEIKRELTQKVKNEVKLKEDKGIRMDMHARTEVKKEANQ